MNVKSNSLVLLTGIIKSENKACDVFLTHALKMSE